MLPRNNTAGNNKFLCALLILSLCFCADASVHAGNILIDFYQKHLSVADGNRCQMYPSCSSYAAMAIDKHGPVMGWVMACDRLVRCGRDETRLSVKVIVNNREYTYDPVDANDFWWFEKEKKE